MKKILLLAVAMLLFYSCTAPFDFESARQGYKEIEYTTGFAEEFGCYGVINIDDTHTWGFEDFPYIDANSSTRSSFPNANQWGDYGLDVPAPLKQKQKDFVTEWFATHKNPNGIAVNWTDYFVQQVSSTEYGRHMDYLLDASQFGTNDHIFNFNSGDAGNVNVNNKYSDKIMYMQGQSTKDFAYHESVSIPSTIWYDHYVIIPGEMIDPTNSLAQSNESIWGMYFVGFDYEAYKYKGSSDNVSRDYYFNDWIVKISPGKYKDGLMKRVMAEDLGEIGDFDFNDVVFDCYINYNEYWHGNDYGLIILQAAGGTMPLYVDNHEVHDEFGVDVTTMVNTGGGNSTAITVSRPIVIWSFKPKSANAIDIPIYVENTKESVSYNIRSEIGKAPGKFAVPTTVDWSKEQISIKTTYPKFPAWVEDQNVHFWE